MKETKSQYNKEKAQNNNDPNDQYRERLKKIIGKKFDTTMIFPLSQFEAAFGASWGSGKSQENLTDEERINQKKWKECRNNILNLGNNQKRNMSVELDGQNITPKKFQAVFLPRDKFEKMQEDETGNEDFDTDRFNR